MENRMNWWREAKFGMFIHWGIYSVLERGEWVMFIERIPKKDYEKFVKKLKPKENFTDEWASLAKETGMKYMVLTARHGDGFSLFDSKVSDYTAPKCIGRDIVKEFVESCRKYGLKVGVYYSLLDWSREEYFKGPQKYPKGWKTFLNYIHTQIEELMTNYGEINILWYDGKMPYTPEEWEAEKLNKMVRELQPNIIINDRSGLPEDYDTPEQEIKPSERDWETCMTLNDHWGYYKYDNNWKTPKNVIINLVKCASIGGNFLLNVGPKSDGTIPTESIRILKKVGEWMKENGESIYGTEKCFFPGMLEYELCHGIEKEKISWYNYFQGFPTMKKNKLYLHVFYWYKEFAISNLEINIKRAYFLRDGKKVDFEREKDRILFKNLPEKPPDPIDTVIVCEFENTIRKIYPLHKI
jgi:alpha-L-fucosidase